MKQFERIVLHVGPDKTGSTAIQGAFDQGRAALLDAGVLVPRGGWHAQLGSCFAARPGEYIYNELRGRSDAVLRAQEDAAYLADLEQVMLASTARTLFLTYEGFASLDEQGLKALAAYLLRWSDRVDVLAYCREPLGYALSAAGQRVRSGMAPWEPLPICSYADYLEALRSAFGHDAVTVHAYDRNRLPKGDVVSDVAAFLGLGEPLAGHLRQLGRLQPNTTLSAWGMRVGEALATRCQVESPAGEAFNARFSRALGVLAGPRPVLPAGLRGPLLEAAKPHTEYLARVFGISFDPPPESPGDDGKPLEPDMVDTLAGLITELTAQVRTPRRPDLASDIRILGARAQPSSTVVSGGLVTVEVDIEVLQALSGLVAGMHLRRADGTLVFGTNTQLLGQAPMKIRPGHHVATYMFVADLDAGAYAVGFGFADLGETGWRDLAWSNTTLRLLVLPPPARPSVGAHDLLATICVASAPPARAAGTSDATM